MDSVTISVRLPVTSRSEVDERKLSRELLELWVLEELRQGRMTHVRAAHELDMVLDDLYALADEHGIYAVDYPAEDLDRELRLLTR